jgi:putative membrane protein
MPCRSLSRGTILATAFVATLALGPGALQAATAAVQTPASLHAADLAFVLHAAEGGNAEVALGKLAASKATEASIQQFGDQMVKDHGMANEELASIASAKGATPPSQPGPAAVAIEQTLAALAEDGFDREYMAQQVAAHETTVALFQSCAEGCIDPEIKAFAEKQVPVIRNHLETARDLMAKAKQQASAE